MIHKILNYLSQSLYFYTRTKPQKSTPKIEKKKRDKRAITEPSPEPIPFSEEEDLGQKW
jgi:hypothetical protein